MYNIPSVLHFLIVVYLVLTEGLCKCSVGSCVFLKIIFYLSFVVRLYV